MGLGLYGSVVCPMSCMDSIDTLCRYHDHITAKESHE